MENTAASVTIHVEVFDPQEMWDHALHVYGASNGGRDAATVRQEFDDMCGPREEPDIGECLRMIFDPGESPPGIQINDSSAEVVAPF